MATGIEDEKLYYIYTNKGESSNTHAKNNEISIRAKTVKQAKELYDYVK